MKNMKKPTVFSLVREQSMFMTAIMSLLTFLSVLTLGVALSIGTGVLRWNNQWELFATVQVSGEKNIESVQHIIKNNSDKIESATEITSKQMTQLMAPWVSGGNVLKNYLPKMWEIKFKTKSDLTEIGKKLSENARFLTHASALKTSTAAGWKMILMSSLILILTLGAIGVCISYIARNTAMLHKRELEILNQIGASDGFIAHQMQIIVGKISLTAAGIGFMCALPFILMILSTAKSARIGLMAMMGLSGFGWLCLILLPITIILFAVGVTHKTTTNILKHS
ncbi:MAG: hypothetical protein IKW67_02330 [Alphaproteobacteria bacterium]|nr:hypothetical protein [Alphaproteobacteria bacterium]